MVQSTADFKGDSFSLSGTLANIDLVNGSGIVIGQYLQKLTETIDVGGELAVQYSPQIPGYAASGKSCRGKLFFCVYDQEIVL